MTVQQNSPERAPRGRHWRFHDGRGGCALLVYVYPNRPYTGVRGINDSVIELDLAASDNPWHMNQTLVTYLSRVLGVPEADIEIVAGLYQRGKVVSIVGLEPSEAVRRLERATNDQGFRGPTAG